MNFGIRVRGGLFAALIMFAVPVAATLAVALASPAAAQTVASIQVEGNRRVEIETIRSYFKPGPGGRLDQAQIDDGLKALIETGLFQDVRISQARGGLLVTVVENPVIGRVAFEGNKKVKDEQLSAEVQSKPRGTLSRPMVQSDAQRIADIYRHSGRYDVTVNPQIIEQPNNRVDLVFEITEGQKTGVRSVEFVGNSAYSSYRLKDIIKTHESNLLSFLAGGDVYDPDRVEADRDLIRRFYLKHGFADVQVVAALTEYDPQQKGFLVTFKIEEGQQYRVAAVNFESSIPGFEGNALRGYSRVSVGSTYNAEALEKSVEEMQIEASRRGYAFAIVRPRGDRNFENHTVSITYAIDEGPRTYIERINVRGNTRTREYVIRREFDISEGDAYNRALVDRAERRLKNLDFFKSVKISDRAGLVERPGDPQRRARREVDRRFLGVGRLFDHRRRAGRGQYFRTQLPRTRSVRQGDGDLWTVRARLRVLVRRALSAGLSRRAWTRPVPAAAAGQQLYLLRHQDARFQPAARFRLARRSCRCSCDTRSISRRSRCRATWRTVTTPPPTDCSPSIRRRPMRIERLAPGGTSNDCAVKPPPTRRAPVCGATATARRRCRSARSSQGGTTLTSAVGYSLNYNTLDNNKNPTDGLIDRLPAGFRRRRRRREVSEDRGRRASTTPRWCPTSSG